MKKIILAMAALLTLCVACEKEPVEKQAVSCEISAPEEGTEIDLRLTPSVEITCDATASLGAVSSVEILVNGKHVAESATVPFTKEYTFAADQKEGKMTIEVKAEGDQGAMASDEVNINLIRTEEPQIVSCQLTAPAKDTNIEFPLTKTIKIAGTGKAEIGSISKVVLKFGEMLIDKVTTVPFEIDYDIPETLPAGDYVIALEITGDKGATAHEEVSVKLTKVAQTANCNITAPAAGTEISIPAAEPLTITGEGSTNYGEFSEVVLKIGGEVISEVKALPFSYAYTLPETLAEGDLTISLNAKGDNGATAESQVAVKIVKASVPEVGENEFVDPRDGKTYKTVTIGDQVWFAENLAYLPEVSPSETASLKDGKQRFYVLNYQGTDITAAKATAEYSTYGVLYNWYAAMGQDNAEGGNGEAIPSGIQGSCPEGWHLPSLAEWQKMEEYVASQLPPVKGNGQYYDLGIPGMPAYWEYEEGLKNVWSAVAGLEGWSSSSMGEENPDLKNGPRNTVGLNIMPAGQCYQTGDFGKSETESNAYFWHTMLQSSGGGQVTFTNMNYRPSYSKFGIVTRRAYSVRCVKD